MLKRLRRLFFRGYPGESPTEPIPEGLANQVSPYSPVPVQEEVSSPEQAQAYLEKVQAKINKLAEEFAAGEINRVQFQELYDHYRREQQTVKRWIEIEPESEAWKDATTEGKSVIIRADHTARVLGHAIYENESGMPLSTIGQFEVEPELFVPMLSSYRAATKEIFGAGMRSSEIEGGRWLCFVPGEFTTLMALFSMNPSSRQLETLEELHRLFEKANRTLLTKDLIDSEELVFPHSHFLGRVE
ncbi:MAG: hypothetical protein GTO18_14530 [Anaerolineales bacterium]|nr:hypothetical protein [Anaerolineales bacterium]